MVRYDVYFGPELPEGAPEKHWIQAVDGQDFFLFLRLYGSDISLRPDDLVRLN